MVATELINFYFTSVVSLRILPTAEIVIATRRFFSKFILFVVLFSVRRELKRKIFNEISVARLYVCLTDTDSRSQHSSNFLWAIFNHTFELENYFFSFL